MESHETLLKGGKNGPVLIAGKTSECPMIHHLLLPLKDEDHMPPDGKPQPTLAEIAALQWWIDCEAPADTKIGEPQGWRRSADLVPATLETARLSALSFGDGACASRKRKVCCRTQTLYVCAFRNLLQLLRFRYLHPPLHRLLPTAPMVLAQWHPEGGPV